MSIHDLVQRAADRDARHREELRREALFQYALLEDLLVALARCVRPNDIGKQSDVEVADLMLVPPDELIYQFDKIHEALSAPDGRV